MRGFKAVSLLVGQALSTNCWAWGVPELVSTCWGARSYRGANKLEGGFQNAACQPQTPFVATARISVLRVSPRCPPPLQDEQVNLTKTPFK